MYISYWFCFSVEPWCRQDQSLKRKWHSTVPSFIRDINPQIQETLQMPSRINTKKRD